MNIKYTVIHDEQDGQALSPTLDWIKTPRCILIIKKRCDSIFESFIQIISYLIDVRSNHFMLLRERERLFSSNLKYLQNFKKLKKKKKYRLIIYVEEEEYNNEIFK